LDRVASDGRVVGIGGARALGIAEFGEPQGRPIFYFHGCPGSRLEAGVLAAAARRAGARLIAIDRPGIGLSPPQPRRQILDWPADVSHLADALGIHRFRVIGFSGGGPYAAACALRLRDRLIACSIVSGAGPAGRALSALALSLPPLAIPLVRPFIRDQHRMRWWLRRVRWLTRTPDRESLARPDVEPIVAASVVEALRQGWRGVAREVRLLGQPWGFALEDLGMPVDLWHGEVDPIVPVGVSRAAARRLRHVRAEFVAGEAHKSMLVNRGDEILATLLARESTQETGDGARARH
jgi:pimeloyl-ACP methyl ester carboxylesterase